VVRARRGADRAVVRARRGADGAVVRARGGAGSARAMPAMTSAQARERFAGARSARMATIAADGAPHLVPIVFALHGDVVYHAVDHKPKRTRELRRLDNIAAQPRVALLADEYDDEDWTRLWWVRADGAARVLDAGCEEARRAIELLRERYAQYREATPAGPVIAVDVERWAGWAAAG
jgi:PPOX class probable F420-dependent enzyme